MIAGRMKHRLRVFRPKVERNGYGEKRVSFEPHGVIWAERVKLSGQLRLEVAERFADYRVEFNIRDAHPVGEGWRVEEAGECGIVYAVGSVLPNRERGMKTLVCERVNE